IEPSPTRVTVGHGPDGGDLLAITRVPARRLAAPGGVTIVAASAGHLSIQAEFTPPDPIKFSTINNAAFNSDGSVGFIGSRSGALFAFSTTTGELQSSQMLGNELMGLSVSDPDRIIAVVCRTARSDQIVILSFDGGSANSKTGDDSTESLDSKK